MKRFIITVATVLGLVSLAAAQVPLTTTFDFEGQPVGAPAPEPDPLGRAGDSFVIRLTQMVDIDPTEGEDLQPVEIWLVRQEAPIEITDLSADLSARPDLLGIYGTRTLSPFPDAANPRPIEISVRNVPPGWGVERIDWQMGDFFPSDQDGWKVYTEATSAPPEEIGYDHRPQDVDEAGFGPPFNSAAGYAQRTYPITYAAITAGSEFLPNSMYLDKIRLTLNTPGGDGSFAAGSDAPASDWGGGGGFAAAASAGGSGSGPAGRAIFDFETLPEGPLPPSLSAPVALADGTPLGTMTVSISRGGAPLELVDLSGPLGVEPEAQAAYGLRTLSPFGAADDPAPIVIDVDISQLDPGWGVEQVYWDMGDFFPSDEDSWEAYTEADLFAGGNPEVGYVHSPMDIALPDVPLPYNNEVGLVQRDHSINRVELTAGSQFLPNSLYLDNLILVCSPTPDGSFAAGSDAPASDWGGGDGYAAQASAGGAGSGPVGRAVVDFEDLPSGPVPMVVDPYGQGETEPRSVLDLTVTAELPDGSTHPIQVSISRLNAPLDVEDLSGLLDPVPEARAAYGLRTLSPFGAAHDPAPIEIRVDPASLPPGYGVEQIYWDMGDFGPSDADGWEAYTEADTFAPSGDDPGYVHSPIDIAPSDPPLPFQSAVGMVQRDRNIAYASVVCGSQFLPNSVYYDNLVVVLAPTPDGAFAAGSDAPASDWGGGGGYAALASAGGSGAGPAGRAIFDFETLPEGPLPPSLTAPVALPDGTPLGTVSISVGRAGALLELVDLSGQLGEVPEAQAAYGLRTLSPFAAADDPAPIVIELDISQLDPGWGIEQVYWDMGDFFPSDGDSWEAYTEADLFAGGSPEVGYTHSPMDIALPEVPLPFNNEVGLVQRDHSIRYLSLTAGSQFLPNSLYLDNLVLVCTPTPDGSFAAGSDAPASDWGGGDGYAATSSEGAAGAGPTFAVGFGLEEEAVGPIDPWLDVTRTVDLPDGTSGDLTLRISRPGGILEIVDIQAELAAADPEAAGFYGSRTLSPFAMPGSSLPLVVEVIAAPPGWGVEQIVWDMGDFGPSDEDGWQAYTEALAASEPGYTHAPMDVVEDDPPGAFQNAVGLVQRDAGITYLSVTCGSVDFPNSVYYDNLTAILSPTPDGTFAAGSDAPASDWGGGGSWQAASSDGGDGGLGGPGGAPAIAVSPATPNLGPVQVHDIASMDLIIANASGATEDLVVTDLLLSGDTDQIFLTPPALPATVAPGASLSVVLSCEPLWVADFSATLQIVSNSGGQAGSIHDVPITVSVANPGVLDQTYDLGFSGRMPRMGTQSFTPQSDTLVAVDLRITWNGALPYADSVVVLRDGVGGAPIATSIYESPPFDGGQTAWVRYSFPSPVSIAPGSTYFLEWSTTTVDYAWDYGDSGYPGGTAYDPDGSVMTGQDFYFRTWAEFPPGNTGVGTDVTVPLVGSAGGVSIPIDVSFAQVVGAGDTTLTVLDTDGPAAPAGWLFGDPAVWFTVDTTATFTGNVTVVLDYGEIAFGNDAGLELRMYDPGTEMWLPNTNVSLDTVAKTITAYVNPGYLFALVVPEGDLYFDPAGLDFGSVAIGQTVRQTIYIRNLADAATPATVAGLELDPGTSYDFSVTSAPSFPYELGPGEGVAVEIAFTPWNTGPTAGGLSALVGGSTEIRTASLQGSGFDPGSAGIVNDPPGGSSYPAVDFLYQTFTASSETLTGLSLRLAADYYGYPNYDTSWVNVYEASTDAGGLVLGALVGSTTADVSELGFSSSLIYFPFSPELALTPGNTYAIEWQGYTMDTGVSWFGSTGDPYAGGSAYDDDGTEMTELDFDFVTYSPMPIGQTDPGGMVLVRAEDADRPGDADPGLATVEFDTVTGAGVTSITTQTTPPPVPSGFSVGDPPVYYDISTTATWSGTVYICLRYNEAAFEDESQIRLMHYDAGTGLWTDITTDHDMDANIICGEAPTLSPFAVAEPVNLAPTADAGTYAEIDATKPEGADVTLDGSGSGDPDGDDLTYTWYDDGVEIATGETPTVTLSLGDHPILLQVSDGIDQDIDLVTITVADNTAPVIVADDFTYECTGVPPEMDGRATATDAVDPSPTLTWTQADPWSLGQNVITWTAEDDAGNSSTATQIVTIVNDEAPLLIPPADLYGVELGTTVDLGTPTIAGGCEPGTPTNDAVQPFPVGENTVTWTVTDGEHTVRAYQYVTVVDTTPPEFVTTPADVEVETTDPAGATVTLTPPEATDLSGPPVVTREPSGDQFPVGTTLVTWTATDASGNTAQVTQNVTVVLNEPPIADAGADATLEATKPEGADTTLDGTGSSDPEGLPLAYEWFEDGASLGTGETLAVTLALGTHTITLVVTDSAGQTGEDEVVVVVQDTTDPVLTTVPWEHECDGTGPDVSELPVPTVYDAVTPDITPVATLPATWHLGTNNVTWTATDGAGNTGTAVQVVTIVNGFAPTLDPPADLTDVELGSTVDLGTPTVVGGCDPEPATNDAVQPFPLGVTMVTWTVFDDPFTVYAYQYVTVVDTTPPAITPPADVSVTTEDPAGATVVLPDPDASDLSGPVTFTREPAGDLFPVGTTVVTWTGADSSGNTAQVTQNVIVTLLSGGDTTPPVVQSISAVPSELWPPNHKMRDVTVYVTATDDSGETPTWTVVDVTCNEPADGDIVFDGSPDLQLRAERTGLNDRVYTIHVEVADGSGNSTFVTATVVVPHDQGNPDEPNPPAGSQPPEPPEPGDDDGGDDGDDAPAVADEGEAAPAVAGEGEEPLATDEGDGAPPVAGEDDGESAGGSGVTPPAGPEGPESPGTPKDDEDLGRTGGGKKFGGDEDKGKGNDDKFGDGGKGKGKK